MTADFAEHDVGRIFQPRGFRLQRGRIEEPGRYVHVIRQRVDGGLVGLEIEGKHPGNRGRGNVRVPQRRIDQLRQFLRRGAAFAPHPDRDAGRVIDQVAPIAGSPVRRRGDPQRPAQIAGNVRVGDKGRQRIVQPHRLARQQIGGEGFHVVRVGQRPPGGRIVERRPEAHVPGRGDGGRHAKRRRNIGRQIVGAMMPAQQRHDGRTVLRHGDHRGLRRFVCQRRGQQADQDPGGADADHRRAGGEQRAQMIAGVVENNVRVGHATREPVDRAAGNSRFCTPRRIHAAGTEHKNGGFGHVHASARLWTRIMEK